MSDCGTRWWLVPLLVCALGLVDVPAAAAPHTRAEVEADIRRSAAADAEAGQRNVDVVVRVFTDEAKQVGMAPREIMALYQEEYRVQRAKQAPGPWAQYKFEIMAVLAAVLAILVGLLRKSIESLLTKGLGRLWNAIYQRFAGSRVLRQLALKKYRCQLVEKLSLLRLPFRPGAALDVRDIYVPLRLAEARGRLHQTADAFGALAAHRRLVVLGAPGGGKSTLLKHIALAGAERRLPGALAQSIPVLLELHRLAESKATLEAEIVNELARTGFPHARTFVEQNLEKRSFLLLLDGLDELPPQQRGQVAQDIKDLTARHEEVQIVVTCRAAVYRGELDEVADQKLELVDFNDQQIQRYLRTWVRTQQLPPGKSVEELTNTLANRPQIKKLAGNPLLLTILAYLYTDHPEIVLPHSRSQFYKTATDLLLEQWHYQHNRFTLPQKRAILEHLALFNQAGTDPNDPDRRTMDFRAVIKEVQGLCPSLNLKPEDTDRLLQEIVERSGLLFALDGGQRYGFAHLTLQEYFTAARLQQEPLRVIEHYEADRDGWRETLRLWCGLASDSTEVIRRVRELDSVMSFECLADTQKVSSELAGEIVAELKGRLGAGGAEGERIQAAFGTVAADPCPRGTDLFTFLVARLGDAALRPMAASALAQTGLMRAAEVLGEQAREDDPGIRGALVAMGDLAVPVLARFLAAGQPWALDDLRTIGTPRAAEALAPLLWHEARTVACQVAFVLGEMLQDAHVEDTLRAVVLAPKHRAASRDRLDWYWKPFGDHDESALPILAGRIAFLIDEATDAELPPGPGTLDWRIAIPACIAHLARKPHLVSGLERYSAELAESLWNDWKFDGLMRRMPLRARERFVGGYLTKKQIPTREDWISMCHPTHYDFWVGWHLRAYVLICSLVCMLAFLENVQNLWHSPFALTQSYAASFLASLLLVGLVVLGALWAVLLWPRSKDPEFVDTAILVFYAPVMALQGIRNVYRDSGEFWLQVWAGFGVTSGLVFSIWLLVAWNYASAFLVRYLLDSIASALLVGVAVCCSALVLAGKRMQRMAMNPLFGLWDGDSRARSAVRSNLDRRIRTKRPSSF